MTRLLSVFRNYPTESTTRVLRIRNGNFNLASTVGMCSVHSMGLNGDYRHVDHSVFIKPSSSLPLREGGREQIAGKK